MATDEEGFCWKMLTDMTAVSNNAICGTVHNENVGYYYVALIPVGHLDGLEYSFRLPTGQVKLDGQIVKTETSDIWEGG
jgi:hypothetical protein